MRNRRTAPILFVVFLALVGLLVMQNNQITEEAQRPPTPTPTPESAGGTLLRIFPELRVVDLQAIRIEDPNTGENVSISRDSEGVWQSLDPAQTLERTDASSIARTIILLPYNKSVNILNETKFADYGLDDSPYLLLQFVLVDGSGHGIIVGDLTPSGEAYYSLVDDRDEIYEIERGPIEFLLDFVLLPPVNLTN